MSFLPQFQVDHPDAVALVPMRQGQDPLAQLDGTLFLATLEWVDWFNTAVCSAPSAIYPGRRPRPTIATNLPVKPLQWGHDLSQTASAIGGAVQFDQVALIARLQSRSFRLLFASDLATFPGEAANYWILILAVLRFLFAERFHLAIKIFRLGDVDILFDIFRAAQALAATIFPEDDALCREDVSSRYFLDRYSEFAHRVISVRL